MKKIGICLMAVAAVALSGCGWTEATRARNSAALSDRPAAITCYTYGIMTFNGRSSGKVVYDDGGRTSFVDASTGRYTVIEGDCRTVY